MTIRLTVTAGTSTTSVHAPFSAPPGYAVALSGGQWAIVVQDSSEDQVTFVGTPQELGRLAQDLASANDAIIQYLKHPLTVDDFVTTPGGLACPQCPSHFDQNRGEKLHAVLRLIENHIETEHP